MSSRHELFDVLLASLKNGAASEETLASVLIRVMLAAPEAIPRTDIAQGKGLSKVSYLKPSAVSKAVQAFLEPQTVEVDGVRQPRLRALLKEDPKVVDEGRGGRPILPIRLHPDNWGLMGLLISNEGRRPAAVRGVVTQLDGQEIVGDEWQLVRGDTQEGLLSELGRVVEELRDRADKADADRGLSGRQLLGVGVNVAGHVHDGHVIGATHMGLAADEDRDLEGPLHDITELPVVVDNDLNLLAVRETYRSDYTERNMAVLAVLPDGVGAGLILNGHVYRGGGGMAGEPGHQTVSVRAKPPRHLTGHTDGASYFSAVCECGHANHVDCYATPSRLLAGAGTASLAQAAGQPASDNKGRLTRAGWVFDLGGRALGEAIATLVNIVNPSRVVVRLPREIASGEIGQGTAAARYLAAMEETLDEFAFSDGAATARAGASRLTLESLPADIEHEGATLAAIRVLDAFVMHARGKDTCVAASGGPVIRAVQGQLPEVR